MVKSVVSVHSQDHRPPTCVRMLYGWCGYSQRFVDRGRAEGPSLAVSVTILNLCRQREARDKWRRIVVSRLVSHVLGPRHVRTLMSQSENTSVCATTEGVAMGDLFTRCELHG